MASRATRGRWKTPAAAEAAASHSNTPVHHRAQTQASKSAGATRASAWMAGKATPIQGWEADVSQVAEGRLRARRTDPPPPADLRVLFER